MWFMLCSARPSTPTKKTTNPKSCARAIFVLLRLLNFHSDRATAHASFVVASIFGLYAARALKDSLQTDNSAKISVIIH
jgi:hypothetical protein